MNLIKKLGMTALGLALAAGVGASISAKNVSEAKATAMTYTCGFEAAEGFTTGTSYQGDVTGGPAKKQWSIHYGNFSTSSPITTTSVALRAYASKTSEFGSLQMDFNLEAIKSVSYKAKAATSNSAKLKLDTFYSSNNGTSWTQVDNGKELTSSAADYSFNVNGVSGTNYRVKFVISSSSTFPTTSNAQLTIDDISIAYDSSSSPISVTGVSLDQTSKSIIEGDEFQLTATVAPDDATDPSVSWSSSNEGVATVSSTGVVTGVAAGNATITVTTTDGGKTATCAVTVTANPYTRDNITVDALGGTESTGYSARGPVTISSSAEYKAFSAINNKVNIQLKSTDSVSGIITSKTGGLVKSIRVEVASGTNQLDVYAKNTAYEAVTDLYGTGTEATAKKGTLIGSLTATGVINVSEDYQYIGIRSNNGAVYLSNIQVNWEPVKPTSINLAVESSTISVGASATITPTLNNPSYIVSEKGLSWTSSSDAVATVSSAGVVTGVAAGNATITATSTADSSVKGTVDITVSASVIHVESVSLNKNALTLDDATSETLVATVLPAGAADKSVSWTSSDSTVATVDSSGLVTAGNKAGTADITVTTTDGGFSAVCTVTVNYRARATYLLVTEESQLVAGSSYLVVGVKTAGTFAMGHYSSGNNIPAVSVTPAVDSKIVDLKSTLDGCNYVLGGEEGAWTFFDGTNYVYNASTTSSSYLKAHETCADDADKWSISISSGTTSIVSNDASSDRINMLLNTTSNLFNVYASGQTAVQLYKYVPAGPTEKTAEAWATFFLSETGTICSSGKASNLAALQSVWGTFESTYDELPQAQKDALVDPSASANIQNALARYDYICGKYNTSSVKNLNEFIEGHVVSYSAKVINNNPSQESNIAIIIVVSAAVVSITALGVLLVLKRRKTFIK